jgi:hypothetical protein
MDPEKVKSQGGHRYREWYRPRKYRILVLISGAARCLFSTKNRNLGTFWRALQVAMEDVGVFYGHLEYFMAIWCNLW